MSERKREQRKQQSVGNSTLAVSNPREYAKRKGLGQGDSLLIREDADGTLRLIPATKAEEVSRATIRVEQAGGAEMLSRLIVGTYALGYDTIEIVGRVPLDPTTV